MRQIKFRVWDQENKCWLNAFAVNKDGQLLSWDKDHENYRPDENTGLKLIQQFTGFYDFNGKEIYDGDIIKHRYFSFKGLAVVQWSLDECCFLAIDVAGPRVVLRPNCEVVGNICENRELLT
jgi:hypothetical protein